MCNVPGPLAVQWYNRRWGGGAECPLTFFTGMQSGRGKKYENEQRPSPPPPLFETTIKFVLGVPKWHILPGKSIFHVGKNPESAFAPSEKYSSYAPDHRLMIQEHNLGAKFHRIIFSRNPKSRKNLGLGGLADATKNLSHRGRCDSLRYFLPT